MSAVGVKRAGTNRPGGSVKQITELAKVEAAASGLLPHQWLLKVARGEGIEQKRWVETTDKKGNVLSKELVTDVVYPDISMRLDSAKAAAPFYAPKLAAQTVDVDLNAALGVHNLTDEELDTKLLGMLTGSNILPSKKDRTKSSDI